MDRSWAAIAGIGFIVLPLIGGIAAAEQVIKVTIVDFVFANILHISDLFAQRGFDYQTL
jgi:hypothetical protein